LWAATRANAHNKKRAKHSLEITPEKKQAKAEERKNV